MKRQKVDDQIRTGRVKKVFVLRLFAMPGQAEAVPSKSHKVRESKNFRYLILFAPNPKIIGYKQQQPENWFLFRAKVGRFARATEKKGTKCPGHWSHGIRWYRSLFTVSQDLAKWQIHSFEFVDLAKEKSKKESKEELVYLGDAFDKLKPYLARSGIQKRPIINFLAELAAIEHGYPLQFIYEI